MRLLLDTNVVSEMRKVRQGVADRRVSSWASGAGADDLYVSAISIEELEMGILRMERRDPKQGLVLRSWMQQQVLPAFQGRILAVDTEVALQSARLHVPNPRPFRDALIAATALTHELTVVTRNEGDFRPMGVPVFNPWQG